MPGVQISKKIGLICGIAVLILSACAPKTATPEPADVVVAIQTAAAKTVVASISTPTETPKPTITLQPSATPMPSLTPAVASQLTPLATLLVAGNIFCDNLSLIKNLGAYPGEVVLPGQTFLGSWRVLNSGSCAWQPGYKLIHIQGNHFGGGNVVVKKIVGVGGIYSLSLYLTAPTKPGTYTGYWRMVNLSGSLMGDVLSVSITVPKPTRTPTLTPTLMVLENHTVKAGDTCESLEKSYKISRDLLKSINPGISNLCTKLKDGLLVGSDIKVPKL